MSNVFYKKLEENGKIVLCGGGNRGTSSLKPVECRQVIGSPGSWSCWFQFVQSMQIGIAFSSYNKSIITLVNA